MKIHTKTQDPQGAIPEFGNRTARKQEFRARWARIKDALPSCYGVLTENHFRTQGIALDMITVRNCKLYGYEGSTVANPDGNWPVLLYWESIADPTKLNTQQQVATIVQGVADSRRAYKAAA